MYVYQWKNIRLVSVWISGLVHSEYYLLLALRFFSSFKPFQFSTETLFKVQSFDMSISLSVSFIGDALRHPLFISRRRVYFP